MVCVDAKIDSDLGLGKSSAVMKSSEFSAMKTKEPLCCFDVLQGSCLKLVIN